RRSAAAVRGTAGRTKTPSLRTTGRRRSRRRARTWRKERGHANGSASPATYRDPAATRSPGGPVYSAFVVTGGTLVTHRIQDLDELRRRYLDFFAQRGHLIYPSASLKSEDASLMYTSAGMVQFKPYFLGATPKFAGYDGTWPRVTTAQKCLRINDIENVGRTLRHHSFFEMLGNFSFGDYFKSDAAAWAWEFATAKEWLGL